MASGLLIKQKQLLAGDGIAINHGETASTISLAENALDNSVRIYDATVAAETGVITITDGTQVSDLAIGDEIRTPDGVYQKVKDSITTTGTADGTRIEVSGITSPADANGYYALQSEDVWKHETANYWITVFSSSGWYWMISNKSDPANPGESLFYDMTGASDPGNPWDLTNWQAMSGDASGTPSLQNVEAATTITNTIDLFEYASTSVASADIVQSVNGNKPDASGNVTLGLDDVADASQRLPEDAANNELAIKKVGDVGIDANTFLMLHFDEESGAPVDSSQEALTINAGDTAVYSNGKFSRARNLNDSYLSTTCSAMATGAGDFTYDGWFYFNELDTRRALFGVDLGVYVALWEDNTFGVAMSTNGSSWDHNHMDYDRSEATATQGVWQHIALVRNKGTVTLYLNGNSILSFDIGESTALAGKLGTDPFYIGYPLGGMDDSADIVDEFRFSNVARWTSDFTPPDHAYTTEPEYWEPITADGLTELMDANKFVPALSSQDVGKFLSVAGSQVQEGNDENTFLLLHFDGNTNDSSDNARSDISAAGVSYAPGKFNQAAQFAGSTSSYVAIPSTSEFPFSGDFTISFWIRPSDTSRRGIIAYANDTRLCIDTIDGVYSIWASSNGSSWDILQADSGYSESLSSNSGRGSIAVTPGVWQHIAYVRSGNDWYLFVNGLLSTHKQRSGQVYNAGEELRIGRYGNDNVSPFSGLIDEFKIDTVARWTEAFTPPEHAYDSYITEGMHTEFTDINENIDAKISTHNADSTAHPDKLPLSGGQMTGELKINATNALRVNNGDYGVILRKDASSFYIMVTAQGDPNGSYTEARPLQIDLATGDCYINGGATKDSLGNVIVTTYAPLSHPAFSSGVEILGATPYIDFHYNNSESDYTFRIVQNSEDTLTLGGKVSVSNTLTVTSGGMSVSGNIKNNGEIQSETSNSYRIVSGNYGTFWRNDGNDLYLMLTDSGDQYGSYNSLRPLTVDLATGVCDISGSALETESYLSSTGVYPRVSMNTTTTADFDTFTAQGNYWLALGARPNGPLGDSTSTTGVLSVYNIQNTHTLQVYNMYSATGVSTQQMYYRWCYSGTWTSWNRITPNAACTPKVGSAVDCTSALKSSAGYTCPSDGWIYADGTQLNINGGNFYTSRLPMVPVMSGDVVKCSDTTIGEFYAAR